MAVFKRDIRWRGRRWLSCALVASLMGQAVHAGVPAHRGIDAGLHWSATAPSRGHQALNAAIECQRRGDYEGARKAIGEAQARQSDLSPVEVTELATLVEANKAALEARKKGSSQLDAIERLLAAGQKTTATDMLKRLAVNEQFLSAADQDRLARLQGQSSPTPVAAPTPKAPVAVSPMAMPVLDNLPAQPSNSGAGKGDPRSMLVVARNLMLIGKFDEATALAAQVDAKGIAFAPNEDSPQKLRADLAKYQRDPQFLLAASHQALRANDFDRAEALAKQADRLAGATTFMFTPDSPAKVLKQIQTARALGTPTFTNKPAVKPPAVELAAKPVMEKPAESIAAPKTDATASAKPDLSLTNKQSPREMLVAGRRALTEGKVDEALQLALKAKAAPGARYGLFEDSPDRLKADVERARARKDQAEVVRLMAEARKFQQSGDLDQAAKLAYKARQLRGSTNMWDSGERPEKLIAEIQAAQMKVVGAGDPLSKQARAQLAEARQALKSGNVAASRKLLEQVESMRVTFDRPGEDSPSILRKDLEVVVASRVGGNAPAAAMIPSQLTPPAGTASGLLVEARLMQKQGRLVEARAKALAAQKIGGVTQPGEDTPDVVLQQLSRQARATVDSLVAQSGVTAGKDNAPDRLEQADRELDQAMALARGFGLDDQAVVAKKEWLKGLKKGASAVVVSGAPIGVPPALTGPSGPIGVPPALTGPSGTPDFPGSPMAPMAEAPAGQGKTLLEKARMELRSGQSTNARRLAEEAFQGPYGVKEEAAAVLRTIDVEDLNQKSLESRRTFDAMVSAYNRKEYEQAKNLLAAVNDKLLDKERQSRLKEILSTPSMLPGAPVAQAGSAPVRGGAPGLTMPSLPSAPGSVAVLPPGIPSTLSAEPKPDSLSQAQAMQKVKFDKMQQQGLDAQREAAEKFRAGQADAALDILSDYVQALEGAGLEANKVAQLRRPVESRLQHFKLLKAQKEFLDKDSTAKDGKKNAIGQKMLAEENRNKKVADQMKLFNTSFKEGKYLEAESYAMRAQELDPDNAMAAAAVNMAKTQRALVSVRGNKSEKEKFFLDGLNDTDKFGQALTIDKPLDVGESMTDRRNKRTSLSTLTSPQRKSVAEREIEGRLNQPVNLSFNNQPLKDVLEDIRAMYQINIVPDVAALEAEGISLDRPITLKLEQISLKSALNLMLRNVHLTWVVKDEVLQITTESQARGKLATVTYQVTDLVLPVENHGRDSGTSFNPLLTRGTGGGGGNTPTPIGTPMGLNGGTAVGSSTGSGNQSVSDSGKWNKRIGTTTEDALIRIITSTIEPQSWSTVGGSGTIEYHPLTMSLVVNQTPNIQEQVADLLNNLRRLLDQEVALEIRLISIAEDFYERIGLDFNLNIKTDRNTAKFEPMITSNQYKPAGYINDPYFKNMVGGITPAGSFTSDLDIPIKQNSFNMTNPAFGNYFGAPGGGLSMGLAFLSDIQVFLFLEAAQGDNRTNVMQAPKLTLFNGQTATLNVGDTQFFVIDVSLQTLANGNVSFSPVVQGYFNGIQLTIQAIISADRRTVRLSPNISMQNLAPGPVNLFPVVVPIFPQPGFNQPNPSDPITFTQLIQQPIIQSVTVQTTVAVPDGGTVLMGGLKRLSEARNEYGPPILSKIPYLNRLFRNTGYGREATSLLMMITPRIIIQEEEEQIQTNFRPAPQVAP